MVDFTRDGYDPGGGGRRDGHCADEHSQPDLVIFTGDIIDGRPFEREYPGGDEEARSAWKCFQAVTTAAGV